MGVPLRWGPIGEPGEGVYLQGNMRDSEGGLRKWSICVCGDSVGGPRGGGTSLLSIRNIYGVGRRA
jgi:hypothetical protein